MPEDKDFYKDLIDNLYDGVYFVDRDRVITYWNKGAERITGYKGERVIGSSCSNNVLNHVTADGVELCSSHCPLAACMHDGKVRQADVFLHHADGHRVPVLVRASPIYDAQGNIIGAVETFSGDAGIAAVRQELHELRHTAGRDPVTGIDNRLRLEARLRAIVAEFGHQGGQGSLLFIDIDHFKQVNDLHGHEVGDKVLRMVAATLKHSLREIDFVGRWGGDEFLAILHDVTSAAALSSISQKLRNLVQSSSLDVADQRLTVTISVGATLLHSDDSPDSIVRRADELMYQSKQAGRNRVSVG